MDAKRKSPPVGIHVGCMVGYTRSKSETEA